MKKVLRTVIIVTITTSTFETNCRLLLSLCLLDATNRIIAIAETPIWSVFMLEIKQNRLSNINNQYLICFFSNIIIYLGYVLKSPSIYLAGNIQQCRK